MSLIVLQILVTFCALALAFARQRPALLVFSLGHLFALIGFRAIEEAGQPEIFAYLPTWLYEEPNLGIAVDVMGFGTLLLIVAALVPSTKEAMPDVIPPMPPLVLVALALYMLAYFFSTRTVVETAYATAEQGSTALGGGIYTLAWAMVLLELRRRVDLGMSPNLALAGVAAALTVLDLLKGATGLAAGVMVSALMGVYLPGVLRRAGKEVAARTRVLGQTAVALIAAAVTAMLARQMRTDLARLGFARASENAFQSLTASFDTTAVSEWANGDQGAAHVLMCTALYEHGFDREWRSVLGALEYTYKPSILVRYLGLERSPEAAWELMSHFIHGGGVNVFGEFYWNGGWPCVVVMGIALVGVLLYIDRGAHRSVWLLALSFAVTPNLVQGYGYGYAQTFRGLANGVFFMLPIVAYLRFIQWSAARQALRVTSPLHALAQARTRPLSTPRAP